MDNENLTKTVILVLSVIGLAFSGCLVDTDPIKDAVRVIDRGIDEIETGSADWQDVLQRVAKELPRDISETIRTDAQNLASRSIAKTGDEFRCDTDFLKNRAVQNLKNLKAKLLGETPTRLPPLFCNVVPEAIDMSVSPSSWSIVTLHGYDFQSTDSKGGLFKVIALDNRGNTFPFSENQIGRSSFYQVTLNFGGLEKWLYENNIQKLIVEWDGSTKPQGEIVVIPWQPQRKTDYSLPSSTIHTPDHIRGDGDFDTSDENYMSFVVIGQLNIADQFINSRVFMQAKEKEDDYTEVNSWSSWKRAYNAPKGWKIVEVRPQGNTRQTGKIIEHGEMKYKQPAGEVVESFNIWGDSDDDEAGSYTRVEAHWRKLEIRLEEINPEWIKE